MNPKATLLEDDDYDLNDDLPDEIDVAALRPNGERTRRFRLQALERLKDNPVRLARLKDFPEEAASLLRWALAEAETNQRALLLAAQAINVARGGFNGLGLTGAETLALANVLIRHIQSEPMLRAA